MQLLKMPNGLAAVGYTEADIPALVARHAAAAPRDQALAAPRGRSRADAAVPGLDDDLVTVAS